VHEIGAIDACAGGRHEVSLRLKAGNHPFLFSFMHKDGVSAPRVALQWRPPGGNRADIPATRFLTER
jgi:hypothetical protein